MNMIPSKDKQEINEILAERAAGGDRQALAQLWEQNKALAGLIVRRWYNANAERAAAHGVTIEDLEQESYFAVLFAAETYKPDKGRFSSWLAMAVKRQIAIAITGTHRRWVLGADGVRRAVAADPLNNCASLDMPLSDDEAGAATLCDLQEDPAGQQAIESVEEKLFNAELQEALTESLGKLPEMQAEVMKQHYYQGRTLTEIAQNMGRSDSCVRNAQRKAIRVLRVNPKLQKWHDEIISSHAHFGTGFNSWQYGGAVEERIVEYLDSRGAYIYEVR